MGAPSRWLDELDLDPSRHPASMGTRRLSDRPWLIVDDRRDEELALKRRLWEDHHDDVFAARPRAEEAATAVVELLGHHGVTVVDLPGHHPLERAGLSVQEDLCLLHRAEGGWHLEAALLCFPSRWLLRDKLGRHLTAVHAPVRGYAERLAGRVDALLDALDTSPVWRRNWFIHPDASLFQPRQPRGGDPVISADAALDDLHVRSERQTLRRLDPPDWALFTIRIQQQSVRSLARHRADELEVWLRDVPPHHRRHRGVSDQQAHELRRALSR